MEIKIAKKNLMQLKKWLESPDWKKRDSCPFDDQKDWHCSRICNKLFPWCRKGGCPCDEYSLTYVKGTATKLTRDL